jgi:hypothetical protein
MKASNLKATLGRVLSLGVGRPTKSSTEEAALAELEMELALLREENARLKVEQHRPADAGRMIDRMRHFERTHCSGQPDQAGGADRGPAEAVEELVLMRDGLVEACREIQRSSQAIRGRLTGLSAAVESESPRHVLARPAVVPPPAVAPFDVALAGVSRRTHESAEESSPATDRAQG